LYPGYIRPCRVPNSLGWWRHAHKSPTSKFRAVFEVELGETATLWPEILHVNRTSYNEASVILYRGNCFAFDNEQGGSDTDLLACFLRCIGTRNSSLLAHVRIGFPIIEFEEYHVGNVAIDTDSLGMMAVLRERCTDIKVLEISLQSSSAMEAKLSQMCIAPASQALSLVDAEFSAIKALRKILVNAYEQPTLRYLRETLSKFGWTVKLLPNVPITSQSEVDWEVELEYFRQEELVGQAVGIQIPTYVPVHYTGLNYFS
jgi:hypothetical protein